MRHLAQIDAAGFVTSVSALSEGLHAVSFADTQDAQGRRYRLKADGSFEAVYDWRGQAAYGGSDGREIVTIPMDDESLVGLDWPDLVAKGYRREPRPETAAEKRAREAEEAQALAEAERARIMALSASAVQFAQACAMAGIISQDEAVAWASSGTLPAILAAAINTIPDPEARFAAKIKAAGATSYERGSPMVMALGQAIGKTEAELDQLFTLAVSL